MSEVCIVDTCPALARHGHITCAIHAEAAFAKDLHITEDSEGKGGRRCVACRRIFRRKDWVMRVTVLKSKSAQRNRPGDPYGWKHVACEPPTTRPSKEKIREAEKPLLEACEKG